jgi:acyl carrier protein
MHNSMQWATTKQDLTRATLRGEFRGPLRAFYRIGGPVMTIATLKIDSNATAREEVLAAEDVRTLIAHRLGVDVKRVTDEAHFADDLGADWLDRLELIIEIEAQFPTVEFTDDDVDQIDVVGDLIRHLKNARVGKVTTRPSRRRVTLGETAPHP